MLFRANRFAGPVLQAMENELNARRNSQLFEEADEVIPNRIFSSPSFEDGVVANRSSLAIEGIPMTCYSLVARLRVVWPFRRLP